MHTPLYKSLLKVTASRKSRDYYASILLQDNSQVKPYLDIIAQVHDPISCKAAWVLENACSQKLDILIPHLAYFTEIITQIYLDSALRPVSKIVNLLCKYHYSTHKILTDTYKNVYIDLCFDWMITDQKVAVKYHAMQALYLLGLDTYWIREELQNIIEKDYASASAGYKAQGRKILKLIKKKN